jgi:hypothetical protein
VILKERQEASSTFTPAEKRRILRFFEKAGYSKDELYTTLGITDIRL